MPVGQVAPGSWPESIPSEQPLLLEVRHLSQEFKVRTKLRAERLSALSDVSFDLHSGEVLAIVGESGCGKSTLARSILQLPRPTTGEVFFHGHDLVPMRGRALQMAMRGMQMVFQDPYASLDPRKRVKDLVAEPMAVRGGMPRTERMERVAEVLARLGLDFKIHGRRRARELSGGQCQRVAIARALAGEPELVICDEPVASLDVSVQAQILNVFEDLRSEFKLAYLFITHDLGVARHVGDRIGVIYLGRLCEVGDAESIYSGPLHPYTGALLSSAPNAPETARIRLLGEPASAIHPPSGCRFRTRCPRATELCATKEPPLVPVGSNRSVACHYPLDVESPAAATSAEATAQPVAVRGQPGRISPTQEGGPHGAR